MISQTVSPMTVRNINSPMHKGGFSLIEVLIVVAVMAVMAVILVPNISSSWEIRKFENAARDIQSTMQRAKMEAVKTKLNHRVMFESVSGGTQFSIERETSPDSWSLLPRFVKKTISSNFNVTVSLPDQSVVFSPLGFIKNYNSLQNTVTLQSPKMEEYNQPDERTITVFAGGSTRYVKS
jgi:prepilin-type N-terminal cleavage/methylation domain-containing protein